MKSFLPVILTLIAFALIYTLHRKVSNALFHSGFGACAKCERTWDVDDEHVTWFKSNEGCFPLCQSCWAKLSPKTRWPYYRKWLQENKPNNPEQWPEIEDAVAKGL